MRQFFNIVVLLLICFAAYSQTYPVQVNTQLAPPFTPYLSDYITPGAQKLMVQIRLNDPTLTDYTCKLRVTIEGVNITIRSSQAFLAKAQPITIQGGGIPEMFYGEDLAEYFNPNALDFSGMSRSQYERGAKLPEGVYRFTIEVLDYHRGTVVSNASTAMAWIILNDPPILNMPRKDTKIKIVDPNNIAFNWTPRQAGSPNAAFTTEYIFRLVEIWPLNRNPYDAFLSQPVLYETTTNLTQIVYGPAEPAMLPGRKYAWQVQAIDVDGRDLFKNQGKSEVFVFQYGDALGVPSDVYLQSANESSLTVGWDAPENAQGEVTYRVQYRPHNDRKTETWYEAVASDVFSAIGQLQASTEYEVQVRTEQGSLFSEYSAAQIFKTNVPGSNDFVCSADVTTPVPPVGAPARTLNVGSTIHAAGFDVVVKSVTASGSSYTGEGLIVVPWFKLAKVKATFKNISVNDQLWLTAGEIKTVWNPDSKFLIKVPDKNIDSTQNAPKMNSGESVTTTEVDSLIEITGAAIVAVTKDSDGNIVVSTTDGERKVLPKGTSYAIVDGVGNGYVVDKNGEVVKTTAAIARAAAEKGNRKYNLAMHFEKGSGKYGFDEKQKEELDQFYQKLDNGKSIGWKAVTRSDYDVVDAVLDGKDYDSKKIHFEVGSTPVTPTGTSDGRFNLNIVGKAEGTTEELLAYYSASDTSKQEILGKLNLISYDKITRNLVVVPVNMESDKIPFDLQPQQLGQELSRIYNQSVAGWQVSMALPIKVELNGTFDDGQTNAFSNYTDDMRKVITAYGKIQDNTYYIFLIGEKPVSDRLVQGRMPRSKQAGFVFTSNHSSLTALTNTIAHELGHGAFNLQHTFKEFSLAEGSTDNLMDYTNGAGEKLYKYQWDHIHDPQKVIGLFEDDEDSENVLATELDDEFAIKGKDGKLYFPLLTPAGNILLTPRNVRNIVFSHSVISRNYLDRVTGTLYSFVVFKEVDGKTVFDSYKISYNENGRQFTYVNDKKETYGSDPTSVENVSHFIMGLPVKEGFRIYKFDNANLANYVAGNYEISSEEKFPIKLFSTDQKVLVKTKPYGETNLVGSGQQDVTNEELEMVDGRFERPEVLILLKIGQIRNAYPLLFQDFTSNFNQWDESLSQSTYTTIDGKTHTTVLSVFDLAYSNDKDLQSLWKNDKYSFYSEFLTRLKNYIRGSATDVNEFLKNLNSNTNRDEIISNVSRLSETEIAALTTQQRIMLLTGISNGCMSDPVEKLVLKLIKYQPRGQYNIMLQADDVLDALVKEVGTTKELLLDRIIHGTLGCGVDDETMLVGDDNYLELMGLIVNMCYSSPRFWDAATEANKDITKSTVEYQYRGFWKRTYDELLNVGTHSAAMWKPSYIKTSVDVDNHYNVTVHYNYWNGYLNNLGTAFPDQTFSPFKPIALINKSGLSLTNGFGYKNNDDYNAALKNPNAPVILLPAIILKYIEAKADLETTSDAVMAAVDVSTIWSGYGALMKGVSGLRRTMVVADMASSGLSITASSIDPEAYPKLKGILQGTSAILGVVSLVPTGSGGDLKKIYEVAHNSEIPLTIKQVDDFAQAIIDADQDVLRTMKSTHVNQTRIALEIMITEADVVNEGVLAAKLRNARKIMDGFEGVVEGVSIVSKIASFSKKFSSATQMWLERLEQNGRIFFKKNGERWDVVYNYFKKSADGVSEAIPSQIKIGEAYEEAGVMQLQASKLDASLANTKADDIMDFDSDVEFKDASGNKQYGGAIVCNGTCGLDPSGCFAAGTEVLLPSNKLLAINRLKKGMRVLSYDTVRKVVREAEITQVITKGITQLTKVYVKGKAILATANHPFFTNRGVIPVASLKVGMLLTTLGGPALAIDSLVKVDTLATVYNIEVDNTHNYYVGDFNLLVHNGDCFGKKYPKIQEKLGKIETTSATTFERSMKNDEQILQRFESGELSVESWNILNSAGSKYVKSDPEYLKKFQMLTPQRQGMFARFSDDGSKTLREFLDDVSNNKYFLDFVNDPKNDLCVKAFLGHKDDFKLTTDELENLGEVIDDLEDGSLVMKWIKRSEDIEVFKNYLKLGNELSDNILGAVKQQLQAGEGVFYDLISQRVAEGLKVKLNKTTLTPDELKNAMRGISVYKEVPLATKGGFMKADIFIVQRNSYGKIEEVFLIENKLSPTTAYTERQLEGLSSILAGDPILLKFGFDGLGEAEAKFNIKMENCFRFHDHGTTDVSKVETSIVDFSKIAKE